MLHLVSNRIRCKWCGDLLESFSVHDFKRCRCGKCFTDGGLEYVRRGFEGEKPDDIYEDLSIYYDPETKRTLTAKEIDEKDIPLAGNANELENRIIRREAKVQHKKELVDQVKKLKSEGNSFSDISKELGLAENVVRQYFRESSPIDKVIEESKDDEPVKKGKPTRGRYNFNTGETIAEYYD